MVVRFKKTAFLIPFTLVLLLGSNSLAQKKPERVKFLKGTSSATVKGSILGYDYKDYLVKAGADQTLSLALKSNNTYNYFVVFSPEEGADNLVNESTEWTGKLPMTGDYKIRVFLMRAGARRKGAAADFTLKITIR
jgi:hypothetical protein